MRAWAHWARGSEATAMRVLANCGSELVFDQCHCHICVDWHPEDLRPHLHLEACGGGKPRIWKEPAWALDCRLTHVQLQGDGRQ